MNLIYKENFKAENKVPNQIMVNGNIYSYGYGGIYKTDILKKKTSALNTETSINIVKFDELENVYAYQNFGFEKGDSGKYNSKILKNNVEYLQLDYPVVDFCVYNNILFVTTYNDISMKEGKIGIYENQKLIKEYDVDLSSGEGCWAICNKNVFFLKTNSALDVDKAELKEIRFEGLNEKLVMPIVTNNADFDKLYINSMEVKFCEDRLVFIDTGINDFTNYNPLKDRILECYFDKKEETLKINEAIVKYDIIKKEDDIMSEIIPYIILIFLMIILELIQVSCTRFKVKKWILPILSFLFSVGIMIYLIGFELADYTGTEKRSLMEVNIGTWMMFPILNIPTIIFIVTNIIFNKINNRKEKKFN